VAPIFRSPTGSIPAVPRTDPFDSPDNPETSGDTEIANPLPTIEPGGVRHRSLGRAIAVASIALVLGAAGAGGLIVSRSPAPPAAGGLPEDGLAVGGDDGQAGGNSASSFDPLSVAPSDAPPSAVEIASPPAATPAASAGPGPTGGASGSTPVPTQRPSPTRATTVAPARVSPNRWVATTGSDAGTGSATRPWRTIQHAVDATPAGGVITVRAGTYGHFVIRRSGVVVQGAAGESAIVAGGNYVVLVKGVSSATIRHLTIQKAPNQWGSGIRVEDSRNVRIEKNLIRDNHSFGIKVKDATNVRISGNEIRGNDTGIELSGSVGGALITGNRIHHNNRMVTSSRGGNGVVFTMTSGAVTVAGNRLWGNRARHLNDSGYDGGAFEVYGASDLRITGNVMWDNNNVMETGTDGSAPCSRITFARNVAYGPGTVPGETQGLILRCASSSLFANNTFDGLDTFAFYVTGSGSFAGSIAGLRIENNIVVRGRIFSLGKSLPSGLVLDHNLAYPGGSTAQYANHLAYVEGRGNTDSLAEFRSWTGYEVHGVQASPRFVDRARHDYRLRAGSPAIDKGARVIGGYRGRAPDIGRFEYGG
jgi:parallel beta-helix repeat protein